MFVYRSWFGITFFLIIVIILWTTVERSLLRITHPKPYPSSYQTPARSGAAGLSSAARTTLQEGSKLVGDSLADIDRARQSMRTWQLDIEPLRDSDTGQRIASRENLAGHMAYLFNQERPGVEELNRLQQRLEEHKAKMEPLSAASRPGQLEVGMMQDIRDLHDQALSAARLWTDAVVRASSIVREVSRDYSQPSSSLQESVERRRDDEVLKDLEADRVAEQKRKEEERKRREAAELEARRHAEERARLIAEAHSPEVQAVLAPFLERTTRQIRVSGVGTVGIRRVTRPQGKSYSAIVSSGALVDSIGGRRMLARIGTSRKASESHWPFGCQPNNWTPENEVLLGQAQDYLRRLGPCARVGRSPDAVGRQGRNQLRAIARLVAPAPVRRWNRAKTTTG